MIAKYTRLLPLPLVLVLTAGLILTACGGGSGNNPPAPSGPADYRVTVTNLTHNQPLGPLAFIVHRTGYQLWEVGQPVSVALETLAEAGDPSQVLNMADQDADVISTLSGVGVIGPGASEVIVFSVASQAGAHITLATMLVNTNDAFAGVVAGVIESLGLNESVTLVAPAYDAGSEANTESVATIPGPAAGGEGFNALRDDVDIVAIHPGAVTSQDGLSGSVLDSGHRWDNPVMLITVERIG